MITALMLPGCSPDPVGLDPTPSQVEQVKVVETGNITQTHAVQITLLQTFSAHNGRVLDLAFSNGGEYLASSGQDLEIKIWDPGTGQALHSFPMRSVDMADIDISRQEDLLASGEAIWDLETRQEVLILERGSIHPAFVAFSPDGGILALARLDQETRLWDLTAGQPVDSFPKLEETRTKRMEFSPDGTLLAEGVIDGSVRIWDVETKQLIRTLQYSGETDIHDIGVSPDGRYLASVGRLPRVVQWDLSSGEVVQTFRTQDNMLGVSFSADGRILAASAGAEKAVLLWDLETGNSLGSLPLSEQSLALTFSPDGRWLAAGTFDGMIHIWGIPTNPGDQ